MVYCGYLVLLGLCGCQYPLLTVSSTQQAVYTQFTVAHTTLDASHPLNTGKPCIVHLLSVENGHSSHTRITYKYHQHFHGIIKPQTKYMCRYVASSIQYTYLEKDTIIFILCFVSFLGGSIRIRKNKILSLFLFVFCFFF